MTLQLKLLIGGVVALLIGALVWGLRPRARASALAAAGGPSEIWEYFSDHSAIGEIALGADGTIYAGSQGACSR